MKKKSQASKTKTFSLYNTINLTQSRPQSAKRQQQKRQTTKSNPRSKRMSNPNEIFKNDSINQIMQLQIENQTLRQQLNKLKRGQTNQESEGAKFFKALQKQNNDLKKSIDVKAAELSKLKKSVQVTNINELEVEFQMLTDETTRLKRLYEECLAQLTMGIISSDRQRDYLEQITTYKDAIEQFKIINQYYQFAKFSKQKKIDMKSVCQQILASENQIGKVLEQENQQLMDMVKKLGQQNNCIKCGTYNQQLTNDDEVAREIWRVLEQKNIKVEQLWDIINPEGKENLSYEKFKDRLESFGIYIQKFDQDKITFKDYSQMLQLALPLSFPNRQQSEQILEHTSLRLQIRRWTLDQYVGYIFTESKLYLQHEIIDLFQQEPLELSLDMAKRLSKFIFAGSQALPPEEVGARLLDSLQQWEVLSEQQEELYDNHLREILNKKAEVLLGFCKQYDLSKEGYVNLNEFELSCNKCDIYLDDGIKKYLKLLFYTDRFELNSVPYISFLQAYSRIEDDEDRPSSA